MAIGFVARAEFDIDDEWCNQEFSSLSYEIRNVGTLLQCFADSVDSGSRFTVSEIEGIYRSVDILQSHLARKIEDAWNKPKS